MLRVVTLYQNASVEFTITQVYVSTWNIVIDEDTDEYVDECY